MMPNDSITQYPLYTYLPHTVPLITLIPRFFTKNFAGIPYRSTRIYAMCKATTF